MSLHTVAAVLPLTGQVAALLQAAFPALEVVAVPDLPGEDHVYAQHAGQPAFDLLVTTARKFVFLWYYVLPPQVAGDRGIELVDTLRDLVVGHGYDLVVKYAWTQVRPEAPALIIRQGKADTGASIYVHPKFQRFVIKRGNPQLEDPAPSAAYLATYRNYDWWFPGAFAALHQRTTDLMVESLVKNDRAPLVRDLRGIVLYAGCAFHYVYPHLGFGMRDVDVNVWFAPAAYQAGLRSSRGVLMRPCEVDRFGKPAYFNYQTRILDTMWNVLKQDTGDLGRDVRHYVGVMRTTSDRWATISQRPILDLATGRVLYLPAWLRRLEACPDLPLRVSRRPELVIEEDS